MNYPERKNALLAKLSTKELTMEQFMLECALWSLETPCMVDYEVRQYPLAPKEWQEYENLPLDKRLKIDSGFFQQPSIKEYISMKSRVYSGNWADYSWLNDCKKIIPDTEEYLSSHLKLDEKLIGLRNWIFDTSPQIDKIREQFNAEVY